MQKYSQTQHHLIDNHNTVNSFEIIYCYEETEVSGDHLQYRFLRNLRHDTNQSEGVYEYTLC